MAKLKDDPYEKKLYRAFRQAGFHVFIAEDGGVSDAEKVMGDGKVWRAAADEPTPEGDVFHFILGDRDEIDAELLKVEIVNILRTDSEGEILKKFKGAVEGTMDAVTAPEATQQVKTMDPREQDKRRDKMLDEMLKFPEGSPERARAEEKLRAFGEGAGVRGWKMLRALSEPGIEAYTMENEKYAAVVAGNVDKGIWQWTVRRKETDKWVDVGSGDESSEKDAKHAAERAMGLAGPETVQEVPIMDKRTVEKTRDQLLDLMLKFPEGSPERQQAMERLKSIGVRKFAVKLALRLKMAFDDVDDEFERDRRDEYRHDADMEEGSIRDAQEREVVQEDIELWLQEKEQGGADAVVAKAIKVLGLDQPVDKASMKKMDEMIVKEVTSWLTGGSDKFQSGISSGEGENIETHYFEVPAKSVQELMYTALEDSLPIYPGYGEKKAALRKNAEETIIDKYWIGPKGEKINNGMGETHQEWAYRFLKERGDLKPSGSTGYDMIVAEGTLLDEGYIRVQLYDNKGFGMHGDDNALKARGHIVKSLMPDAKRMYVLHHPEGNVDYTDLTKKKKK